MKVSKILHLGAIALLVTTLFIGSCDSSPQDNPLAYIPDSTSSILIEPSEEDIVAAKAVQEMCAATNDIEMEDLVGSVTKNYFPRKYLAMYIIRSEDMRYVLEDFLEEKVPDMDKSKRRKLATITSEASESFIFTQFVVDADSIEAPKVAERRGFWEVNAGITRKYFVLKWD